MITPGELLDALISRKTDDENVSISTRGHGDTFYVTVRINTEADGMRHGFSWGYSVESLSMAKFLLGHEASMLISKFREYVDEQIRHRATFTATPGRELRRRLIMRKLREEREGGES